MAWTWAALMPHPPIIVHEVGQGREDEAADTLRGTREICQAITALNTRNAPEAILVLSPHQPYVAGSLFLNSAEQTSGNLGRFNAGSVSLTLRTPMEILRELTNELAAAGIKAAYGELRDISPDHGSIVPLHFLAQTFPDAALPPIIFAGPSGMDHQAALAFGNFLAHFGASRRLALLASGDLSHRLKPGAPAGYNPDGKLFDQAIVEALVAGTTDTLTDLSPQICENAGECGLRPALILLSLVKQPLTVFSYEGPFGVGYCNALWSPDGSAASYASAPVTGKGVTMARSQSSSHAEHGHAYARLARMTIAAHLTDSPLPTDQDVMALDNDLSIWNVHQGCFVSIKTLDGALRGCIGTFLPTRANLAQEIMGNAISAATRDPRFAPIRADEMDNIRISVDVLSSPEPVTEGMELDPVRWGVIVIKGNKRGLLLPDLPGVTSVEQQIAIASQKAGISNLNNIEIQRFSVSRHYEDDA